MKYLLFFPLFLCCLILQKNSTGSSITQKANAGDKFSNSLNLLSSREISPLAKNWISEFKKVNAELDIKAENFDPLNPSMAKNSLYLVSESDFKYLKDASWKMIVGRNAIVPVINAKNPFLDKILIQGITWKKFQQLIADANRNWGTISGGDPKMPLRLYASDKVSLEKLAAFTQLTPQAVQENLTIESGNTTSSVVSDIYAIEFCNLTDVLNSSTNEFLDGIKLLPIDKNSNGRIDYFENIYSSPEAFTRGVWVGKYPGSLCGNIYAAAFLKPTDPNTLGFLTWVQTEGQDFLNSKGYSVVASSERNLNLENLANDQKNPNQTVTAKGWWMIGVLAGGSFLIWLLFRIRSKRNQSIVPVSYEISPILNEKTLRIPGGLYFDKSHTWAFMEKEGVVKIGIDDFLQHITGELTHIDLKDPGEVVRKGEKIFTISHNGKKLEIHAPVSGIIREKNRSLTFDSTLLNSSPYNDGWIYVIEPKSWLKEIRFLFMREKYIEWLGDEVARLKDFFAVSLRSHHDFSQVILQDGGEIRDNVLAELDPKIWEDFQSKFIDASK